MNNWAQVRLGFALTVVVGLSTFITTTGEAQPIYRGKHSHKSRRFRPVYSGPTALRYSPSTQTYYRTPIAQSTAPIVVNQPPVVVTPPPIVIPATTVVTPSYSFYEPRRVYISPTPGVVQQSTTFYRSGVFRSQLYSNTQTYVTPNIRTPSYYTPRFYRY
ncbi:MAG: hypothetical protein ACFCD0_10140 [Gemmataceae bacterium]